MMHIPTFIEHINRCENIQRLYQKCRHPLTYWRLVSGCLRSTTPAAAADAPLTTPSHHMLGNGFRCHTYPNTCYSSTGAGTQSKFNTSAACTNAVSRVPRSCLATASPPPRSSTSHCQIPADLLSSPVQRRYYIVPVESRCCVFQHFQPLPNPTAVDSRSAIQD